MYLYLYKKYQILRKKRRILLNTFHPYSPRITRKRKKKKEKKIDKISIHIGKRKKNVSTPTRQEKSNYASGVGSVHSLFMLEEKLLY